MTKNKEYNYKEVEEALSDFYEKKQWILSLEGKKKGLEKRREMIEDDIKRCNISFSSLTAMNYDSEVVSTNRNTSSSMEKDIERGIGALERKLSYINLDILKITNEIMQLQEEASDWEVVISALKLKDEEGAKLLECKFLRGMTFEMIGRRLRVERCTAYQRYRTVLKQVDNLYKTLQGF